MPATVLKRKHSLKGKNIFPLLKRLRENKGDVPLSFARLAQQQRTEDMCKEECMRAFKEITGEKADEFLDMAGIECTDRNARLLLHFTVIFANENGQPGQVPCTTETVSQPSTSPEREEPPPPKKQKVVETGSGSNGHEELLKRIARLEQDQDSVESLKDKVRGLALQANPNEALLLLAIEDLAKTARRKEHSDAETFEELARQAVKHQNNINIASLALGVVGGKAVDVVVKVLNKCVKEKQIEKKINAQNENEEKKDTNREQSPLYGLYPPFPFPQMWQGPGFGYNTSYQRSRGRGFRPKGPCFFCDMPGHTFKECQKMKLAKSQNK